MSLRVKRELLIQDDTNKLHLNENNLVLRGNNKDNVEIGSTFVQLGTTNILDLTTNSLGINNLTPSYTLDTVGDINTSTEYRIGGVSVLNSTTLGSGIVNSSLTSVGTLSTLNVSGDINTLTEYDIGGVSVLNSTTLGSNIVNSSLTSVGTLSSLTMGGNLDMNGNDILNGDMIYVDQLLPSTISGGTETVLLQGTNSIDRYLRFRTGGGAPQGRAGNIFSRFDISHFFMANDDDNLIISHSTENNANPDIDLSTNRLLIDASGNMAIGNITPTYLLDVDGDINTSSEYRVSGTSVLNSTTLGSGIVNSSLTSVGTLTGLTMGGDISMGTNNISGATSITATNLTGTLQTAAQANITSVGTLTSLDMGGDIDMNTNDIIASGTVYLNRLLPTDTGSSDQIIQLTGATAINRWIKCRTGGGTPQGRVGLLLSQFDNSNYFVTNDDEDLYFNYSSENNTNPDYYLSSNILTMNGASGLVGIGTTTPVYKMDVSGDINTSTEYRVAGTSVLNSTTLGSGIVNSSLTSVGTLSTLNVSGNINTLSEYRISGTSVLDSTTLGSGIVNSSLTSVGTLSTLDVSGDLTVDTTTLHVDSSTNRIGIGTVTPSTTMHITTESGANGDCILRLEADSDNTVDASCPFIQFAKDGGFLAGGLGYTDDVDNNDFNLSVGGGSIKFNTGVSNYTNAITRMLIDITGNIGIGTTTPSQLLDVNGNVNVSGTIYASGGQIEGVSNDSTTIKALGNNNSEGLILLNETGGFESAKIDINVDQNIKFLTGEVERVRIDNDETTSTNPVYGKNAVMSRSGITSQTIAQNNNVTVLAPVLNYSYGSDISYSSGQFTINADGFYHIQARVSFSQDNDGYRQLAIVLFNSGGTALRKITRVNQAPGTIESGAFVSGYLNCSATDYIQIEVRQASGGNRTISQSSSVDQRTDITIYREGNGY